uniref:Protein TIC 20 n=1 Tax=Rhizophora mucronata TaxID=61149 RepID=A0A2P2J3X2_RHIMU
MAVAAAAAQSTAATATSTATTQASRYLLKSSQNLAPAAVGAALFAHRYRDAIADRCTKILGACNLTVGCQPTRPALPKLSVGMSLSHLSAASSPFLGEQGVLPSTMPILTRQRRHLEPPKAYKNDFFSFHYPVLAEKPEWWWRTLACLPYLIALQLSDVGYYLHPLMQHYNCLENLIYFVPGAISRLPVWFSMIYIYFAYIGIVKNKACPHFFRFHLMMGMLLETALQLIWYTSNFFPLIHYHGKLGMHYWAGVGIVFIVILLQCVGCALAGGYAHLPFISDAAYIHTLFNIGGYRLLW